MKASCKFCHKECLNDNSLRNHERLCPHNPNRVLQWRTGYKRNGKASNQFLKARELGLPDPIISDETRNLISMKAKMTRWTDAQKAAHSTRMKQAVASNPLSYSSQNVCGRNKQIVYNGNKFHSTWEVNVAVWLDNHKISWQRDVTPIPYQWNNRWHLYFPDFYLPSFDLYVEVKGYETDRDLCKWESIKDKLIVVRNNDIENSLLVKLLVEQGAL